MPVQWVTAAEAVARVQSGQRVYVQAGAATPHLLLQKLVARHAELRDVEIAHMHTEGPADYARPEMEGSFRHNALFIGPNVRRAVQDGRADYTPDLPFRYPGIVRYREPAAPGRRPPPCFATRCGR